MSMLPINLYPDVQQGPTRHQYVPSICLDVFLDLQEKLDTTFKSFSRCAYHMSQMDHLSQLASARCVPLLVRQH